MADAFFGMRASDDFTVTGQRPENWREMILYLYPNGDAPLTALLAAMKSESADDPHFHWFTKSLPSQSATLVDDGVYTDALSTAYVSGGSDEDDLWLKVSTADAKNFRVGHQVLIRDSTELDVDVNATVTAVGSNYVKVALMEDDDNGTHDLSDADTVLIIGNSNAEGALIPDAISYDPTEHDNYTQIFRTPLDITRTARKTRLRTGDAYKEAKREALELHSIEQEKAFLWGIKYSKTGSNGHPERFTQGLIAAIKAGGHTSNYATDDPDFHGVTWANGGEEWLDKWLEVVFRYGKDERLAYVGSGALLELNKLVKANGQFQFTPKTMAYGIKVMEWVTPFGVLYMKRHPLFSYEATNRYSMLIFDPSDIKYRYIDDTSFYADGQKQNTGHGRYDGTKEEYLTECGLEYHFPTKCALLQGFGDANPGS